MHRWGEIWRGGGDQQFGVEEGTKGPLLHAKFHPYRCNVSPLQGEKPQNRPLSKLNIGALHCAQCCRCSYFPDGAHSPLPRGTVSYVMFYLWFAGGRGYWATHGLPTCGLVILQTGQVVNRTALRTVHELAVHEFVYPRVVQLPHLILEQSKLQL